MKSGSARPWSASGATGAWNSPSPARSSKSEHCEELGGREVTFVFRLEKIARGFGSHAMLSPSAVRALGIEDRCESYGRSAVDGMSEFFVFHGRPR